MDTGDARILDVIIVGGGPAGLSAALVLARACKRIVVIDAGQPRNHAAREMNGFLGRDGTDPRALLADGRRELGKYGVEVIQDTVQSTECAPAAARSPFPTVFAVGTAAGRTLLGRKLLFATGIRDELPDLPGLVECYGVSVHHCPYCDGWKHRGKRLLAFGGTAKAACGLGIALRGWSDSVTVLTDGQSLDAENRQKLDRNGVASSSARVQSLVCERGQLRGVNLERSGVMPADALFFHGEQKSQCDLPLTLGCDIQQNHRPRTSPKQKTNVHGLFLAGDADGDVQFVIVAAAEGATAAVAINRELQDEDRGN